MVGSGAPSIRPKALRFPPSSRIATFSLTPISLAFATAASTIFCASSEEMLYFFTTLAIGLPPLLDLYCVLDHPVLHACIDSGNHSAIHVKIRPSYVRGLRTRDKRHQRSYLINVPVPVECCESPLRYRPIARGGIRIRVNRTRLDIVDCDAPPSHLSGQPLSEHLDRSLCGRVGHEAGRQGALAHGRADHNDAAAALHVLQRRLRRNECAADIDANQAVQLLQRGLLEPFRNGCSGIVHKDVEPAECRHRLFDRSFDGVGISGVRLNCDRLLASAFNLLDDRSSRVCTFRVGDGYVRPVRGQTLSDCGTNAPGAAGNERNLSFQFFWHRPSPLRSAMPNSQVQLLD